MDCADVLDRLVALEDDELGVSEERLVRGHLAACAICARTSHQLADFVPRPGLVVPDAVRARLARLDGPAIAAAAAAAPLSVWRFPRGVHVPAPAALGYAMILALAVAWGFANWRERAVLEAQIAQSSPPAAVAPEIPARDYRPASWTPGPTLDSP